MAIFLAPAVRNSIDTAIHELSQPSIWDVSFNGLLDASSLCTNQIGWQFDASTPKDLTNAAPTGMACKFLFNRYISIFKNRPSN